MMTSKNSFFFILRIVFIIFSLQFIRDAFYKWDGYSYYMRFMEFLPDLALSFILWSVPVIPAAVLIWAASELTFIALSAVFRFLTRGHAIFAVLFAVIPYFFKKLFYPGFSITEITGLGRAPLLASGIVVLTLLFFLSQGRLGGLAEKAVSGIDERITPLVWIFSIFLILSAPLSFMKNMPSDEYVPSETGIISSVGERPNIVLLTMDALTALDMELYGYELPTTPFISEWSKNASVFQRYYAASNWTSPTNMSMMTGQRVWTHKAWYHIKFNPIRNYKENLPRVLRDNGYDTYAFVQNVFAHPKTLGFGSAFSVKEDHLAFKIIPDWWFAKLVAFSERRPIVEHWIFRDSPVAAAINEHHPDFQDTLVPPDKVYDAFFSHLKKVDRERGSGAVKSPFFAWLHVFPPHEPYLPPLEYRGIFGDPDKYVTHKSQYGNFNFNAAYDMEKQPEVDILRKRYAEFILYCDERFREFISRLEDSVDMSNTVVILSSDHGESFSHGWLAHYDYPLFEPLVRLPLIIKMPGEDKGRKIEMLTEQTDLAPTILEIAGIQAPEWMDGRSLMPLMNGGELEQRPVLSMQFLHNRSFNAPITSGSIAVWEGDYKLIHNLDDGSDLLFNLKDDPDERDSLVERAPDITGRLLDIIKENLAAANNKISIEDSNKSFEDQ